MKSWQGLILFLAIAGFVVGLMVWGNPNAGLHDVCGNIPSTDYVKANLWNGTAGAQQVLLIIFPDGTLQQSPSEPYFLEKASYADLQADYKYDYAKLSASDIYRGSISSGGTYLQPNIIHVGDAIFYVHAPYVHFTRCLIPNS